MVQINKVNRRPSFAEQASEGLSRGAEAYSNYQQNQQKMQSMNQYGESIGIKNLGSLPPEIQKEAVSKSLSAKNESGKHNKTLEDNRNILRGLEKERGLDQGSLSAYESNPSLAERSSRPSKEPKKTQASQPIDPEQLDIIKNIRNTPEYEEAPPLKKYQMMTDGGVSKENAQAEADIASKQQALQDSKGEARQKLLSSHHKESEKYDEELLNKSKTAHKQIQVANDIEKIVNNKDYSQYSLASIFKGMGKVGNKISELMTDKDLAALQANIPALLEGFKELFGGRITDADLRLIEEKLPSISKSAEANQAITNIIKKYARQDVLKAQIGAEIRKSNEGYRPLDYSQKVEDRYNEMIQPVRMIKPNGKVTEVEAYNVGDAIKIAGFRLENE